MSQGTFSDTLIRLKAFKRIIVLGICKTRTGCLRMADADGGCRWRMGKCGWKNADEKLKK